MNANIESEIPFEVAFEVVKRHFEAGIKTIVGRGYSSGRISIAMQNWTREEGRRIDCDFFASGYEQRDTSMAKTLDEAIAGVPTRKDDRSARIERLRAELSKLESEESK